MTKKRKKAGFVIALLLLLLGAVPVAAYGVFYFYYNKMNIQRIESSQTAVKAAEDFPEEETKSQEDPLEDSLKENLKAQEEEIPYDSKNVYHLLLVGTDARNLNESSRSDSMILVSINRENKEIIMTSIMRDIYCTIPGAGNNRINAAYAYGGASLLLTTLEYNFGIHVDDYAVINFYGFMDAVNAVGGIEMEVTAAEIKEMNSWMENMNVLLQDDRDADKLDESDAGTILLNGRIPMNSKRKLQNLTKNTVLFMISNFSTKIIAFLLVPLYTHVFTTSEYGTVDLMITMVQLLIPVLTLNIQEAILRYGLDAEYDSSVVIENGFRMIGWSTLFLGAAEGLFYWGYSDKGSCTYLLFLCFFYLFGSAYNVLSMYLKAVGKMRELVFCGILNAAATCILNVLLLVVFRLGVNGYMIASVTSFFLADLGMFLLGNLPAEFRRAKHGRRKGVLSSMLAYSIPLSAGTIGWWLNSASDKFLLFLFCGAAANGLYTAAYKIPTILAVLQDIFYNAWSVSAIEEFDQNDTDGFLGNVYMIYSALSVLACSGLMFINVFLIKFLYSESFFESWKYVPILLVGAAFSGLLRFLGCFYLAVKKTKTAALTNFSGALVHLGFSFLLIPEMGAFGASIATLLGYILFWVIRMKSLRSIITMRVRWGREGACYTLLLAQSVIAVTFENSVFQIPFIFCIVLLYFPLFKKSVFVFYELAGRRNR